MAGSVDMEVLRPALAAVICADPFVREIRTIATLQHRTIVNTNLRTSTLVNTYCCPGYEVSAEGTRIPTILSEQNDCRLVVSPNWTTELHRKVAEAGAPR